jgi:hypothetical protein
MDNGYSLSDISTATGNNNGFGDGGWMMWIFALLILPGLFGGGMFGNRGGQGEPVTESALCNSMNFNNLENAVGRLGDQVNNAYMGLQNGMSQMGYATLQNFGQMQRDMCTGFSAVTSAVNSAAAQQAQCCCETQRAIDGVNYNSAINTSAIIQAQTAGTQKVLDYLCSQETQRLRDENMKNYFQSQLCGVVRYPNAATYSAGNSIWSGCCCGSAV